MTGDRPDHPLVREYLDDLSREAADLPRTARHDLVDQISAHIAEALARDGESEAAVRNVIAGLGPPAEIVAAARSGSPAPPARAGTREAVAILLLLVGGVVVPIIGWFAGVVLLWSSPAWTVAQKLTGTLVVPGGLLVPVVMFGMVWPSGMAAVTIGLALLVVLVAAPIAVAVHLWRSAARPVA